MTQVLKSPAAFSSDLGRNIPCLSVRHYEASPPANLSSQLVDADNANASTKEEEWITKKKVELTTKKQIETRVKRQVVLEDGKVVEDSGPIVTTNTTEDTEKQEHEHTEHRHLGDDENDEGWVAVPGTNGIIKEVRENKVRSREEKEETLETEDVQHLGDITDDAYKKAIQSNRKDIRLALRQASRDNSKELASYYNSTAPRIVSHTTKSRKTVDTEDTKHLTGVQKDGKLITETTKTTEHEEISDTEEPDNKNDEEEEYETHQTSSQKFRKTKDQEFVEYLADGVKIGEEIRYEAENVEGDRKGNPENLRMDPIKWESLSEKIRRMRIEKQKQEEAERMDALTKKPLNFDQEEQTRKVETSKWLEHHFGSESRSSKSSLDDEDSPSRNSKTSTSFINVTMKSAPLGAARDSLANGKTPESGRNKLAGNGNGNGGANGHFKGISEWRDKTRSPSPVRRGLSTEYIIKPKIERSVSMSNHTSGSRTGLIPSSASRKKQQQQAASTSDNERSYSPFQPIREKLQTSSSSSSRYRHHHLERAESSPLPPQTSSGELESSPLYASVQQRLNNTSDKSSAASYDMTENYYRHERSRPDGGYNGAKIKEEEDDQIAQQYAQPIKKSNLVKKESTNRRKWSLRREDDILEEEPSPDYSPRATRPRKAPSTPDIRISSATPPPNGESGNNRGAKRIYQKTRFSAEMPLVVNRSSENGIKRTVVNGSSKKNKQQSGGGGLGETFRKLVGKFRSGSGDRKSKKNGKSPSDVGGSVRQQNGYQQSSYQSFNNVDNGIATDSTVGAAESRKPVSKSDSERSRNTATSPSVSRRSYNSGSGNGVGNGIASNVGTQTLDSNYRQSRKKKIEEENMQQSSRQTPTQKYYLGEDPFGRSIYGKEKEYDGTAFFRRRYKNSNSTSTDEERKGIIRNHAGNEGNVLGGRLSKSTSRLASENAVVGSGSRNRPPVDYSRGGIQTLPRKLREDKSIKKQVFINDPSSDQETIHSRRLHRGVGNNSSSMINVSVVNNVNSTDDGGSFNCGPAKPARTYRTSLLRSKSFNVQPGYRIPEKNVYVSNPQLHRLEESPPPLKSPGIVTSINRSTKDLSKLSDDNLFSYHSAANGYGSSDDNRRRQPTSAGRTSDPFGGAKTVYHQRADGNDEGFVHKRLIAASSTPIRNNVGPTPRQKSVQYSSSFHSGNYAPRKPTVSFDSSANNGSSGGHSPTLNGASTYTISRRSPEKPGTGEVTTNKTITRTAGNNDDYSETVRITSKSNDPLRPSITNTVQSFSKKTVPVRDGRVKTIESSETTRVTKSHYRAANGDSDGGNGKTKNHYNSKNGSVVIEVRNGNK